VQKLAKIFEPSRLWRVLVQKLCNYATYQRFYRAHGMQTRSSDEKAVCPSVCQTRGLWQNGRKIFQIFIR